MECGVRILPQRLSRSHSRSTEPAGPVFVRRLGIFNVNPSGRMTRGQTAVSLL